MIVLLDTNRIQLIQKHFYKHLRVDRSTPHHCLVTLKCLLLHVYNLRSYLTLDILIIKYGDGRGFRMLYIHWSNGQIFNLIFKNSCWKKITNFERNKKKERERVLKCTRCHITSITYHVHIQRHENDVHIQRHKKNASKILNNCSSWTAI